MQISNSIHDWPLPRTLDSLEAFQVLAADQKHRFHTRLLRAKSCCEEYLKEISEGEISLSEILDQLELDFGVTLATRDNATSAWIINSTWAQRFSRSELSNELEPAIREDLNSEIINTGSDEYSVRQWMIARLSSLKFIFEQFFTAHSALRVIAHLMAIEVFVSTLYLGALRMRYNTAFDER